MLEKTIERKVVAMAKSAGWLAYKWTSPSQRGVPDRIFIRSGVVVFIEFKSEIGKLTPLQGRTIEMLRQHGACVHVCNSIESGAHALSI